MSYLTGELHSFELINCSRHPEFRVEAFCTREDVQPSLLCIKCLLDPTISKDIRGEFVTIKDILAKSVEKRSFSVEIPEISNEALEKKILELSTKTPTEVFEKHVETQMKKLDREIERIKEALGDLRAQFVKFFEKQSQALRNRDDELKKKVYQFFEEKEEMEKMNFDTIAELLRRLRMIYKYDEYEKFIRILFKKYQADEKGEGSLTKKLINLLDDIKQHSTAMKSMRIDTHVLEGKYC